MALSSRVPLTGREEPASSSNKAVADADAAEAGALEVYSAEFWAYVEELLEDLWHGKVQTIHRVMDLSAAEAASFWRVYTSYEKEIFELGDRRVDLVQRFVTAQNGGSLDEALAKELATEWFELEFSRLKILRKYHRILSEELSAVLAAQFGKIEHRFSVLVNLVLASKLPLVEPRVAVAAGFTRGEE